MGKKTILIVEDEIGVRELARDILELQGYIILEACHGKEALQVCENHHGTIDLLLSDVIMPGMKGTELAELLAPTRPRMKIMFMSGYTNDSLLEKITFKNSTAFLQKPFSLENLTRKVQELLGENRP